MNALEIKDLNVWFGEGAARTDAPFHSWMRFSFGPPMDNVALGLTRLEEMLCDEREGA